MPPAVRLWQPGSLRSPQRIEYAGKYIFEMIVNLDGAAHKDLTVIPLYVDVVSANEVKKSK